MAGDFGSAMSVGGASASGMGAGAVAPFGGRFGAAVPSNMSGGGLSYRPRPSAGMSGNRPSFTIGPMGGGVSGSMGSGRRPFTLLGSSSGLGRGGALRQSMPAASGAGVMPPSFGSPFRQPPSLLNSTPGAGSPM